MRSRCPSRRKGQPVCGVISRKTRRCELAAPRFRAPGARGGHRRRRADGRAGRRSGPAVGRVKPCKTRMWCGQKCAVFCAGSGALLRRCRRRSAPPNGALCAAGALCAGRRRCAPPAQIWGPTRSTQTLMSLSLADLQRLSARQKAIRPTQPRGHPSWSPPPPPPPPSPPPPTPRHQLDSRMRVSRPGHGTGREGGGSVNP